MRLHTIKKEIKLDHYGMVSNCAPPIQNGDAQDNSLASEFLSQAWKTRWPAWQITECLWAAMAPVTECMWAVMAPVWLCTRQVAALRERVISSPAIACRHEILPANEG